MSAQNQSETFCPLEKQRLENLRKTKVPRYLFRAFHRNSSGAPDNATMTALEIIPPAFFNGKGHAIPYDMGTNGLVWNAEFHYSGGVHSNTLTEFSSWAASLHLVLFYGTQLTRVYHYRDVHVAVIDTQTVDIYAWHVPHLGFIDQEDGIHEYLIHGCIRGKGYKAVRLEDLQTDLDLVFPELKTARRKNRVYGWGRELRDAMFQHSQRVTTQELETIRRIASRFDTLSLPVSLALLNLRARPWLTKTKQVRELSTREIKSIRDGLGAPKIPEELKTQPWLQEDMVLTKGFDDVRQWIRVLYYLANSTEDQKESKKSGWVKKRGRRGRRLEKKPNEVKKDLEEHGWKTSVIIKFLNTIKRK
ncbi:hypothetical protein EJ04DRAFT_562678 [Polyplosphaeria fusca]|uniref:Uncharacterized protein n=1 Tax=Polyplosphaeria fusca TaxID=682080 RepID=A0A9P4V4J0_9PLEO|nr:hypothetical protein EJ04DRAFT_562678 [Polyplosphaeria fusca]